MITDNQRQRLVDILKSLPPDTRDEFSVLWEHLAVIKARNTYHVATGQQPTRDGIMMLSLASDDVRQALIDICAIFDIHAGI